MNGKPMSDRVTSDNLALAELRIQCQLAGRIFGFEVSLLDQGLVLRGRARTYYAKQLAQQAVMKCIDLPVWANEIEVCGDGPSQRGNERN
jgi:hypothetical protein